MVPSLGVMVMVIMMPSLMAGRRMVLSLVVRISKAMKVKVIFMLMALTVKAVKVRKDLETTTVKPMPTPRTTVGKSSAE